MTFLFQAGKYLGIEFGGSIINWKKIHTGLIEKSIKLLPVLFLSGAAAETRQQFTEDHRVDSNIIRFFQRNNGCTIPLFECDIKIRVDNNPLHV